MMRGHPDFDAQLDAVASAAPCGAGAVHTITEAEPEGRVAELPAVVLLHREWHEAIRRMHAEGCRDTTIAAALHVSTCTISRHRKLLGLPGMLGHQETP